MSIATRITSMEEHIEQAYDELQGLGADLTNVNKNIENISSVLDDIYDSLPSVSGEGTSLTLDDTRVGKIKSTLKGNTSQTGTPTPSSPIPVNVVSGDNEINVCGKNLFDKNSIEEGKRLGSDGLPFGDTSFDLSDYIKVDSNTQYTYSRGSSGSGSSAIAYYDSSKTFISRTLPIMDSNAREVVLTTPNNATYVRIADLKTTLDSMQFEKGSSASTYEAYQGNTYNIDLPVENLYNATRNEATSSAVTYKGDISKIYINGTPSGDGRIFFNKVYLNAGTYTFSGSLSGGSFVGTGNQTYLYLYRGTEQSASWTYDTRILLTNVKGNVVSDTFTISESNYYYLAWYLDTHYTWTNAEINYQVERGTKFGGFTPYGTTPIELCKIGDYQDYIYKDNGSWYLHKEIEEFDLSSITFWNKNQDGDFYTMNFSSVYGFKSGECLSNIFSYSSTSWAKNCFGITATGVLWISTKDETLTSSDLFVSYLTNKNVIMYGVLATPTNTEITYTELINQLNAIEQAQSKENQTNISQVNNDLPFIISASALKEWSV